MTTVTVLFFSILPMMKKMNNEQSYAMHMHMLMAPILNMHIDLETPELH